MREWVDWSIGGALGLGPTSCDLGMFEFPDVNCGALADADYMPGNPSGVIAGDYDSNYGIGQFGSGSGEPLFVAVIFKTKIVLECFYYI